MKGYIYTEPIDKLTELRTEFWGKDEIFYVFRDEN